MKVEMKYWEKTFVDMNALSNVATLFPQEHKDGYTEKFDC